MQNTRTLSDEKGATAGFKELSACVLECRVDLRMAFGPLVFQVCVRMRPSEVRWCESTCDKIASTWKEQCTLAAVSTEVRT